MNTLTRGTRRAPRSHLSAGLWTLVLGALVALMPLRSCAQSEDTVKCAFIYNFAKLIDLPATAFADASAKITVGFIGADALADSFTTAIAGKNVNSREFDVKKLAPAAAASCQLVYVGEGGPVADVVTAVKGKPVITIGEGEAFTKAGGMIGFIKDGPKVAFGLNLEPTGPAGLKVNPKLKGVAKSVIGG